MGFLKHMNMEVTLIWICIHQKKQMEVCVCVCVCVWERERERERDSLLLWPICVTPTVFVLLGYTIAASSEEMFGCGQWRGPET